MVETKPTRKSEPVAQSSADALREQTERLKSLFPESVVEGKIDLDKLRALIGDEIDPRPERYTFSWAGKRDATRLLQVPSRATIIPSSEDSVAFDQTANAFIEGDNLPLRKNSWKCLIYGRSEEQRVSG